MLQIVAKMVIDQHEKVFKILAEAQRDGLILTQYEQHGKFVASLGMTRAVHTAKGNTPFDSLAQLTQVYVNACQFEKVTT